MNAYLPLPCNDSCVEYCVWSAVVLTLSPSWLGGAVEHGERCHAQVRHPGPILAMMAVWGR